LVFAALIKPLLRRSGFFVFLLAVINVGACTWLHAASEPEVTLTSVSFGSTRGLTQVINLGVAVRNPNGFALSVNRLDYRIFLEDGEVASGRRVDPLTIAANDSASFSVPVEVDLLSGLPLLEKLMRSPKNTLAYRLEVDADVVNFGLGMSTMIKESTIRLTP
jgi:LEA14-like dessication related protein